MIDELQAHLAHLCIPRCPLTHPEGHARVQEYVRTVLDPTEEQKFEIDGFKGRNLIRKCPGEEPAVIVGAHYDAVPGTPGADDNASGVAALLAVARYARPKRAVWFAALDLEEWGMLGGRALAQSLREPIELMISLEMLAFTSERQSYPFPLGLLYPRKGNYIGMVANGRARKASVRLRDALAAHVPVQRLIVPLRGWPIPETRLSDHAPFWDAGHPAVMLTDTAWLRNPNYHRPTDTLPTLDVPFLEKIVRGLIDYLNSV